MNFRTFIYYCALCGGWAGFICWAVAEFGGVRTIFPGLYVRAAFIGALLGLLIAGLIGLLDGLLNSTGFSRFVRVLICIGVGAGGGAILGMVGEGIRQGTQAGFGGEGLRTPGWVIVGGIIGASIAVFDILRASGAGKGMGMAIRKLVRGIGGGLIGGALGGAFQDFLSTLEIKNTLEKSSVAIGFVVLGMCIGLLIALAQVLLKEAWVRVERGFKAGREMMLSKPDTSIGRAEGVDIALFGDMGVEKKHARIVQKGGRYVLFDDQTPGGTFVNGERIYGPTPLSNGDLISMGRSEVRFQEKAKH